MEMLQISPLNDDDEAHIKQMLLRLATKPVAKSFSQS
jgi:hypothetical protein